MNIHEAKVRHALDFFQEMDLLSASDAHRVLWFFRPEFPFRAQLELADSVHVHVKVPDTARLPRDAIVNAGATPQSEQEGYVKYAFAAGVNLIFSSIPVAEDDRLADAAPILQPFLDHAGIDIRKESAEARERFDSVVELAGRHGWRHVAQGGAGRAVYCCHTQVSEKHWVYPPRALSAWTRPLEFAFGPLVVNSGKAGCDLRPIDPARLSASRPDCGAPPHDVRDASAVSLEPIKPCCDPKDVPNASCAKGAIA